MHCAPADAIIVVSDIGEQWSPHTAPAIHAEIDIIIIVWFVPENVFTTISACMAGAVCGDHCSPISDTTIMASAGAQCNHMNHVSTQLPYVIVVAVISCVTYVIAGFVQNPVVPLIIGLVILIGAFTGIKYINKGKSNE